jgi:hypothetical protein
MAWRLTRLGKVLVCAMVTCAACTARWFARQEQADPWVLASAVVQLLLMGLGAYVSIETDWAKRNRTLVLLMFATLGISGTIATIIASARQAREQATANSKLANSLDKLNEGSLKIAEQTREISALNHDNLQLQKQLLDSNSEIRRLASVMVGATTGGDSFAYVIPSVGLPSDPVRLILRNQGRYPLQGVSVDIRELSLDGMSREPLHTAPITLAAGAVWPMTETLRAPETGTTLWQLVIYSQARPIHETIALRRDADGWPEFRINAVRAAFPKVAPSSVDSFSGSTRKQKNSLIWTDWSESLMRKTRRLAEENAKKQASPAPPR